MTHARTRADASGDGGAGASGPVLRVEALGIRHEGAATPAPAEASFEVQAGDVVLLLGPSGSGKSSLALALNGLIPQSIPATLTGTVRVAGHDTASTPVSTLSAHVGMVFQDPDAQLVTGSLFDEVAFGPENLALDADEIARRVEHALRRVGLWERRFDNPDHLSGGGRQRLAIACALAMRTAVLVLDEPTANLDPAGIEDVYAALGELADSPDAPAIVLIEHNLDAAVTFTRRVVVLDADGRTVADGGVDEVLRGRADELHEMGVWLPVSTLAAMRLRTAGWHFDDLPLTPRELRAALASGHGTSADADDPRHPGVAGTAADERTGGGAERPVAIEARGLRVQRGRGRHRTTVLQGVDLTVHSGEFVAVIGPNGAGKTSLIQALAGVIPSPRGSVTLHAPESPHDAHDRRGRRSLARRVGFVFQNPEHQFVTHTVFDELAHSLRGLGLDDAEIARRVQAMLQRFGLEAKADQHPFLLSGGQKRRLSVGTALIAGAPTLVLDEPTFGQDRARAEELLSLLDDLHAHGTTIIVVTHDMQLVADHATRTLVVDDGRIVADGPTAAVFADEALLAGAGLRPPPLARALHDASHPLLRGRTSLAALPGGRAASGSTR